MKFRNLKLNMLVHMVTKMEPDLEPKAEEISALGRVVLLKWVCWALGVMETTDFPSEYPTLRNHMIFVAYCVVRYRALGRRLRCLIDGYL